MHISVDVACKCLAAVRRKRVTDGLVVGGPVARHRSSPVFLVVLGALSLSEARPIRTNSSTFPPRRYGSVVSDECYRFPHLARLAAGSS
jgi:hypothetical protein